VSRCLCVSSCTAGRPEELDSRAGGLRAGHSVPESRSDKHRPPIIGRKPVVATKRRRRRATKATKVTKENSGSAGGHEGHEGHEGKQRIRGGHGRLESSRRCNRGELWFRVPPGRVRRLDDGACAVFRGGPYRSPADSAARSPAVASMTRIGLSGWSYKGWKGPFYLRPPGLRPPPFRR
jgi:hypothetical protein